MSFEMSQTPLEKLAQRQLTDRIGQENDRFGTVPSDEVIQLQPIESFQLSSDLRGVLQKEQQRELEQIFQEVCEINNEFVGEPTVKTEAYLEISDESSELSQRCSKWFARFVVQRLSKHNHRDGDSLVDRYLRLRAEFERFFIPYFCRPRSIGYVFFDQPAHHARYEYFSHIFSAYFTTICGQPCFNREAIDREPRLISELHGWYSEGARTGGWHLNRFIPFLERLAESPVLMSKAESRRAATDEANLSELASIAKDIKDMRPFLAGSSPDAFITDIGGQFVGLRWKLRYGIAHLCVGATRDDIVRETNSPKLTVDSLPTTTIRHDGILADVCCPWITTESWSDPDGLLLNLAVLEFIRDLLFQSYDRIDFVSIRQKALTGEITPEDEEQSLAVAADDFERRQTEIAVCDPTSGDPQPEESHEHDRENPSEATHQDNRPRSMRLQSLLNLLTRHFGCEVSTAKGSEIKVYRAGGRIFTLGRHTLNREVEAVKVSRLLRRLEISISDWIKAVYS